VLTGVLALHDIRDVEAFTLNTIHKAKVQLQPQELEDLHTYLIEETWLLARRYQPGGITFSTWAGHTLPKRIIDWKRKQYGRTHNGTHKQVRPTLIPHNPRHHPTTISLDQPAYTQHTDDEYASQPHRTPSDTTPTPNGNTPTDRNPDHLARLLRTRSSDEAWRNHQHHPPMQNRTT